MAVFRYADQPGMIGKVGSLFGEQGVNIGSAAVGAESGSDNAVMVVTSDAPVSVDTTKASVAEAAIAAGDEQAVSDFLPEKKSEPIAAKQREKTDEFKGARRFSSSDGYEILDGKKAKDNDYLTSRMAKSFDLWLHAADYPGSHVVVRNPNRKDIPVATLIEAAQLAAFYSDAREKPKAAVNYTAKKFVNKPKRSAPARIPSNPSTRPAKWCPKPMRNIGEPRTSPPPRTWGSASSPTTTQPSTR